MDGDKLAHRPVHAFRFVYPFASAVAERNTWAFWEPLVYMVSTSWKIAVVLLMICLQIFCGSLSAPHQVDRPVARTEVASLMQDRAPSKEGRMVLASDIDHHVRCGQPCHGAEIEDFRSSDLFRYVVATEASRESVSYRISRPPRQIS